ncbi:MAG: hypothetical protein M3418_12520, partial [Gemmatimonadota bacterium]|nr:hypothetical protein [Gemmatimonadota bacterium]
MSELPDLRGDWAYSATEIRVKGGNLPEECRIDGMRLTFGEWESKGLFGRSSGGQMLCSGTLASLSGQLPSYPIRDGGSVAQHFSFSIGTSDWLHTGFITHDTVQTVVGGDTVRSLLFTDTLWG